MRNLPFCICASGVLACVFAVYGTAQTPDLSGIYWATQYNAKIQIVGGGELLPGKIRRQHDAVFIQNRDVRRESVDGRPCECFRFPKLSLFLNPAFDKPAEPESRRAQGKQVCGAGRSKDEGT